MEAIIAEAAGRLGIEPVVLAAVIAVESSGSGFDAQGRVLIRVEAHMLWNFTSGAQRQAIDEHFLAHGPMPWEGHYFDGHPYHGNPDREWAAYACAVSISADAACRATSWGLGQVLGDWEGLGFPSAAEFVAAQGTAAGQIDTMVRFIERNGLVDALKCKDWAGFARGYNGRGQVEAYAARLASAYERQLLTIS